MADRSTYRSWGNIRLIEEAKYNPNAELAIVLGERLEDMEFDVDERVDEAKETAEDMRLEANKLDDKVYELGVEIDQLELMISQRDDEIADLQAQIEQLQKGN